jgi:hypothetical protein
VYHQPEVILEIELVEYILSSKQMGKSWLRTAVVNLVEVEHVVFDHQAI